MMFASIKLVNRIFFLKKKRILVKRINFKPYLCKNHVVYLQFFIINRVILFLKQY